MADAGFKIFVFVTVNSAPKNIIATTNGTVEDNGSAVFAEVRQLLEELKAEDACLSLKDLAVNGNDLMALGFQGREIGSCLNALLEQVLEERLPNEKRALLDYAAGLTGDNL